MNRQVKLVKLMLLILVFSMVSTFSVYAQALNKAAERPNIIVFMADDMGYADAGFTGAEDIKTPNLDLLAASGVVFTHGYANHPFCGPSRAALLSGRYPQRFGFETNPAYDPANPFMGISPEEILFPKRLQETGYRTGVIGKWHLGAADAFHPNNRGFDYFYGFLGGGHDYFRIDLTKPVWEAYLQGLVRNDKPATFEGYLTTALSQDAARFVERNKDNPFFLFVSYNAPHQPLQAPQEDIDRYSFIKDKRRRVYAAMVDVMDRGIGEVVDALKKNDIFENTLIFFLSDNGGPQPDPKTGKGGNASCNKPFRGGKGNMYDGGVHVPFIACWPARIEAGTTFSFPVNSLDIARTAVEVAGADASTGKGMEGVDLIPYVLGEKCDPPHEAIFWRSGSGVNWAVLTSDKTKLVDDRDSNKAELFYLPDDISESTDLIQTESAKAEDLYSTWKEWNEDNIRGIFLGYKDYHKKRDAFYKQARAGELHGYPEK